MTKYQERLAKLRTTVYSEPESTKQSYGIKGVWKPKHDITATYRMYFLPDITSEEILMLKTLRKHELKKNGQFLGEYCLQDLDDAECPICKHQYGIYTANPDMCKKAASDNSIKDEYKTFFPKEYHYANILMVNDPINPENNGQVFLYEFKKSIYELIMEQLNPELLEKKRNAFNANKSKKQVVVPVDEDIYIPNKCEPFNPFDPYNTRLFLLSVTYDSIKKLPSYTHKNSPSQFRFNTKYVNLEPIATKPDGSPDDAKISDILDRVYSLNAINPYKTPEELQERLLKVLNPYSNKPAPAIVAQADEMNELQNLREQFTMATKNVAPDIDLNVAPDIDLDALHKMLNDNTEPPKA